MTNDQIILFCVLAGIFGMLLWGRYRYDLVTLTALLVAVVTGVVPKGETFVGFGHPAIIIIALVLVVSRGLIHSGAIDLVMKVLINATRSLGRHIVIMSGVAASLSAMMNNVGALALLMPVEIKAAHKAKRSPALTLMPLSFATILGGLITLIGTPPNIIIAAYREEALGESFGMFDFTPVGIVCAAAGVAYIALFGWRLIPAERTEHDSGAELFNLGCYIAEVKVPEISPAVGKTVQDLDDIADEQDAVIVGLVRQGKHMPGRARRVEIRKNDILVVETAPSNIDRQGASVKIVVSLGQEADRRCSAGLERLDSSCGRVADALEHSTCGACQREDVLRGVIEAIGMAILTKGYVLSRCIALIRQWLRFTDMMRFGVAVGRLVIR